LDPLIDMNNPESWENFKSFLGRQQYGTHFSWPRRSEFWAYQVNIHIKYFLQQFPFYNEGFLGWESVFRRAVPTTGTTVIQRYSVITLAFGVGGAYYHWKNDWKRFLSVFSMFAIMGMGLVLIVLTLGIALVKEGIIVTGLRGFLPYVERVAAVLLLVAGSYIVYYWLFTGGLIKMFV
ncbi:MAG: hypothetical protein IH919_09730, partial [Deltaproteobacteria bacterium]|nr:hypothetical protein [Deltaproteobacteria bacterium]